MSGRASRRKGHDFERKVARELRDRTGMPFKRGFQTRGGGEEEADVFCKGLPYHFECKKGKSPPLKRALQQAEADAGEDQVPIAVVAFDKEEPIVMMRWAPFLDMLIDHMHWLEYRGVVEDHTD